MNVGMHVKLRPSAEVSKDFRQKTTELSHVICKVVAVSSLGNCTLVLPHGVQIEGYSHPLPDGSGREYLDIHEDSLKQVEVVNCLSCKGSGIYRGSCEPKGVGVICLTCNGEGFRPREAYGSQSDVTPFTGYINREGVEKVHWSWGGAPHISGPAGEAITYAEFLAGKRPPSPEGTPDERVTYFSSGNPPS